MFSNHGVAMKLSPHLSVLIMTIGSLCHATTVDVYNSDDMAEAMDLNKSFELVLHTDILLPLPENKSTYYYSSDYVFSSAEENNPANLSFYGAGDERGEVLHNCAATFQNLGNISFVNWINKWCDLGGGDKDVYASSYGGALSGDDGDNFIFHDNGAVSFGNIVYDSSDWGANSCEIKVHGGAIHTVNSGRVEFLGNAAVTLQGIRCINVHDTNYSYKNFYSHGGAIYAPTLTISDTKHAVTLSHNEIYQGICTDVVGEGKGGAAYVTNALTISGSIGNVSLDSNNILVANRAEGGALYLSSGSKGAISENSLHVQLLGNKVKVAPDMDYGVLEDSLTATAYARGGAIYVGGELRLEQNSGNITIESNSATADYSLVADQSHDNDHADDPAYALGGAVYLAGGATLSISNNGTEGVIGMGNVSFSKNEVSTVGTGGGQAQGGAIYADSNASLNICGNTGSVTFSYNKAAEGAALFLCSGSTSKLNSNTGKVEFSGNTASERGGAIFAQGAVFIENNTGGVMFSGNSATHGGAIYAENRVDINENSGGVEFSGNTAIGYGGAIYAKEDISLSYNAGGVRFSENEATGTGSGYGNGGAIYAAENVNIDITHNQTEVLFANNNSQTGAIHLAEGAILNISDNSAAVTFQDQSSTSLYGEAGSVAHISNNDSLSITKHEILYSSAVCTAGELYIEGNRGNISFSDNSVLFESLGGVFTLTGTKAKLSISGNTGSISATRNYVAGKGGVIYADSTATVEICDNADVVFTENDSRKGAAAIDIQGSLYICNNTGTVIFGNNRVYDEATNTTTLLSISVAGQASFTAAAGRSIEFRDSITVGSTDVAQPALILNKDSAAGDTPGDIVFTGQYTDTYAAESLTPINTEASRYSRVQGDTLLHAGRLVISHGATLAGDTLTTTADKGATIVLHEGGTLAQEEVVISSGSILQAGAGTATTIQSIAESPAELTLEDVVISTPVCGYLDGGTLIMESGSTYTMNGGILDLEGGTLTLNAVATQPTYLFLHSAQSPVMLGGEYVLLLFSGVSELTVNGEFLFSLAGQVYGTEQLSYDANQHVVYLHGINIPEPATVTLSLLALGALAARRRRSAH